MKHSKSSDASTRRDDVFMVDQELSLMQRDTGDRGRTLFVGGLVFDGVSEPLQGLAVFVEDGRIRRVAPSSEFEGFAGKTVNTAGGTMMPGLIDCHVHLSLGADEDVAKTLAQLRPSEVCLRILENAQAALMGGVTAVRDLGGRDWLEMGIRDAFETGRHLGPIIKSAGKVVCMTGGHAAWVGIEADGVDEVVKAVRTNIRAGADCIKVMATGGVLTPGVDPLAPHLTVEELTAAVRAAHMLGRKVASHAQGATGIRNAIMAGVDSIEHGFELTDDVIALMLEKAVYLVPTLSATRQLLDNSDRLPRHIKEKAMRFGEMHQQSFRRYVVAGGKVAMGTDAGTPFNYFGNNGQELAHMVALGLPALDALRSATSRAADLLDLGDTGIIREGYRADLLLVEGNPALDVTSVADVNKHRLVLKDGRSVYASLPASAVRCHKQQRLESESCLTSYSGCSCFVG
jgi:imidazolonepropionase-like amidohydrolase